MMASDIGHIIGHIGLRGKAAAGGAARWSDGHSAMGSSWSSDEGAGGVARGEHLHSKHACVVPSCKAGREGMAGRQAGREGKAGKGRQGQGRAGQARA